MSETQRWGNEVIALAIALTVIGIVIGVGILVQSQFESIKIGEQSLTIPEGVKLSTYAPYIQTIIVILIIAAIVSIVFTLVIPKLRAAAGGAGPAPT